MSTLVLVCILFLLQKGHQFWFVYFLLLRMVLSHMVRLFLLSWQGLKPICCFMYRRCLRESQAQSSSRSRQIVNTSTEVPIPPLYPKHYIQSFSHASLLSSLNIRYANVIKTFTSLQVFSLSDLKIKSYINLCFSNNLTYVIKTFTSLQVSSLCDLKKKKNYINVCLSNNQ